MNSGRSSLITAVLPAGICIWQLPEGELAKTVSVAMKRKIDFFTIFHVFFLFLGNGIYSSIRNHGNLKSSNCVVDSFFVLKVMDFGLHFFLLCLEENGVQNLLL